MSVSRSVDFAASLLREIYPLDRRLVAVIRDEEVAHLIGALTDEVLRIRDARSAAARFRRAVAGETYAQMGNEALSRVRKRPDQTLSRVRKRPDQTLPLVDRVLLRVGAVGSWIAPVTVMRMVKARLRSASSGQVIPLAGAVLAKRLGKTHAEGSRTNVNLLGEAIIGEDEAIARRDGIVALLRRPDVDAVSVKLSSVGANISALAFDATVERLKDRLRPVYRAARDRSVPALVTLDMEEYRDLELTASVFIGLLSEVEFSHYTGGIVLQAYLPDAHGVAERLANFGRSRVANGGAPIRVRLVKGANLAMERVEAELRGWPLATYSTKTEVDVSFKRLLGFLLGPSHDGALIVGLASHNLFDIAWGFEHRRALLERGAGMRLEFETLEGMAEGLARAIARHGASSLVYSPVVDTRSFESAIAYLVRRLDENTTPENFLNALADLHVDSDRFRSEAAKFSEAVGLIDGLDVSSKRAAVHPTHAQRTRSHGSANAFENEADTDFSVPSLREPILQAVESWCPAAGHIEFADHRQVDECIGTARSALETWSVVGHGSRKALLDQLGAVISKRRAEIIAVMVHETSKTVAQADPEVSEAVDFARYYACSTNLLHDLEADGLESRPYGVVVVAPPWNFPFAILVGGVCAALAAGNVVVIKPAPEARSCAQMVAKCCWNAGFSKEVVQFLPCEDNENGQHLISHPDVNVVLLTGAIETARMFLRWRPKLTVMGETSGKNAIVVTASADIELALKDLVSSAFGHAGQKCSAASLAILAPCWYDDPEILIRLADAVRSLRCGPASDPSTDVPPLIGAPSDRLRRALTVLGDEERWLVEPRQLGDDARHWSPGVILGVRPGSWFHRTECFGPVLGVMRADNLAHAVEIQNGTDFGLTAGLHSLDPAEIAFWTAEVQAGNLYVNRPITGAIVQRQPFGGWKSSSVGPGSKAGGPSHVMGLRWWCCVGEPNVERAANSFRHWWDSYFNVDYDPAALASERNVLRHRCLPNGVAVRVGPGTPSSAVAIVQIAAEIAGTRCVVSNAALESDLEFSARIQMLKVDRVRVLGLVDDAVRVACHDLGVTVDEAAVTDHGRVELLHWVREQAVSTLAHRHGHIRASVASPTAS